MDPYDKITKESLELAKAARAAYEQGEIRICKINIKNNLCLLIGTLCRTHKSAVLKYLNMKGVEDVN